MDDYPRISFRLPAAALRKVEALARVRNATRSQVLREAIDLYFSARVRPPGQGNPN